MERLIGDWLTFHFTDGMQWNTPFVLRTTREGVCVDFADAFGQLTVWDFDGGGDVPARPRYT